MTDATLLLKADPLWGKRCIAYNLQADLTDNARRIFIRAVGDHEKCTEMITKSAQVSRLSQP